jgi:hypothetical protein
MKKIKDTKYFILDDGTVVRILKPRVKNGVHYWNLVIGGKLKAFSEKTIKKIKDE